MPTRVSWEPSLPKNLLEGAGADADEIKQRASGQWVQLLQTLCRLSAEQLNPAIHQPCPKCGGTDRFRAFDDVADTGGLFCNQCFNERNGDGFAAIMWLLDIEFGEAVDLVAAELGSAPTITSWDTPAPAPRPKPSSTKTKKIHESRDQAFDAMAWALAKEGVIDEQRSPDQVWVYERENGEEAGAVGRWNTEIGKTYRQVSRAGDGWVAGGMDAPRPLYKLPAMFDAATVYVVEGEKAADALVSIGLTATTPSQGAQSPHLTEWRSLADKRVYILPDNDQTGREFGVSCSDLIARVTDVRPRVLDLSVIWPDCPKKGDAADWVAAHTDTDHAELRERLKPKPKPKSKKQNKRPDREAECVIPESVFKNLNGILGDTYRHIMGTALYPLPEISLAAAVSLVSVITARKMCDSWDTRSNVYSLAIAPTASGKDYPRKVVQDVLFAAGGGHLCGPEDLASAQGLSSLLMQQPASLLMLDEFGKMLGGMLTQNSAPHLAALAGDFLKLYSSSNRTWTGRAYADTARTPVIPSPSLTIMGSSTALTVWANVSSTQIHDGLLGRCHLYTQEGYVPLATQSQEVRRTPLPETLLADCKFWINEEPESIDMLTGSPVPNLIPHTEAAWKRQMRHADAISVKRVGEDPLRAAIWSRATEGAAKLALISALSRRANKIEIEDAEWAIELQCAMSRKLIRNVSENMSDSAAERIKNRIMGVIRTRKKWTWNELTRKTQWLRDAKERTSLLAELQEAGRIEIWGEGGKTNKARWISVQAETTEEVTDDDDDE